MKMFAIFISNKRAFRTIIHLNQIIIYTLPIIYQNLKTHEEISI